MCAVDVSVFRLRDRQRLLMTIAIVPITVFFGKMDTSSLVCLSFHIRQCILRIFGAAHFRAKPVKLVQVSPAFFLTCIGVFADAKIAVDKRILHRRDLYAPVFSSLFSISQFYHV